MFEHHGQRKVCYQFTDEAQELLGQIKAEEISDINEAIREGNPPPKCKRLDQIQRMAASLFIFNHIATSLLQRQRPQPPPMRIDKESVVSAQKFIMFADSQKQMAIEVRYIVLTNFVLFLFAALISWRF